MFKHIALITNSNTEKVKHTLQNLVVYLQNRNINFVLDPCCADLLGNAKSVTAMTEPFAADCDLAIAIGGDGTMLKAAHLICNHQIPLLGINQGRLGFLADIPAEAIQRHIDAVLAGNFVVDERFLLHAEVLRNGQSILTSRAFNDVILQQLNLARLIEFETFVNGTFVQKQRADGLIISSPTGSTAYALSGGGAILHPSLDALALVPICPHALTNRPIVIDGNSRVEIIVGTRVIDRARLTCDGKVKIELAPSDRVQVGKADLSIKLIHPTDYDYYSILRAKLRWGEELC